MELGARRKPEDRGMPGVRSRSLRTTEVRDTSDDRGQSEFGFRNADFGILIKGDVLILIKGDVLILITLLDYEVMSDIRL
jgi:hypothetical protein